MPSFYHAFCVALALRAYLHVPRAAALGAPVSQRAPPRSHASSRNLAGPPGGRARLGGDMQSVPTAAPPPPSAAKSLRDKTCTRCQAALHPEHIPLTRGGTPSADQVRDSPRSSAGASRPALLRFFDSFSLLEVPDEQLYIDTYWADPRIHTFGNMGFWGALHAAIAPLFTYMLDRVAYSGSDVRDQACSRLASMRRAQGKPVRRVADLGCGTGISTRALAERMPEAEVIGIDTSKEMLCVGSVLSTKSANAAYSETNAEDTQMLAHSFDVVSIMFLLHEAPSQGRRRILEEARRLLAPGGSLLMVDIHSSYEPSPMMVVGEPYIFGYLENIDADLKEAGFQCTVRDQPGEGRASVWIAEHTPLQPRQVGSSTPRFARQLAMPSAAAVFFMLGSMMQGI